MIAKEVSVLDDGIIFKFLEKISAKMFDNTTTWGFVIRDATDDVKRPRWGVVERIGPKVTQVSVGQYVLIENLQWTNGLEYNGDKFWKTNESKLMMVSDEKPLEFK